MADAVPVPKLKPVTDIKKHLRTIFLTPVMCNKIVAIHVGLAVLEVIDKTSMVASRVLYPTRHYVYAT